MLKRNIKELYLGFWSFLRLLVDKRNLVVSMVVSRVKSQHTSSWLGFIWNFITPMVMIGVLWVVFSVGFRVTPVEDVSFIVWLMAGMSIWSFFSEALSSSVSSVLEHGVLIKKTIFPSQILPLVNILSGLVTHLFFLSLLVLLLLCYKIFPTWYWSQIIYYLLATVILGLGIGWAVASMNVFVRDVAKLVGVILQVGFWATPIFWNVNILPEKYYIWIKLNPVYYLVQGYREALIYRVWFWQHPWQTLYFWTFTGCCFVAGALIFRALKPHFADCL